MTAALGVINDWYRLVYADLPGYLSVVTLPGGCARFYPSDRLDEAGAYTAHRAAQTSVYAGALTLGQPPAEGRGTAADTIAAPGLWADLDLAGPGHALRDDESRKLRLPGDTTEALTIVDDLGLAPTATVHSGHGLQLWWLLDRPAVFATDEDRCRFTELSQRWGATQVELGRRRGFHVDDVSDPARLLRPPGTVNRKTRPVAVRLVEHHPERRYTAAELLAACIAPEPRPAPLRPVRRSTPRHAGGRETPADAFARIVGWDAILEPAGFTLMSEHGGAGYWHHPASTSGPHSVSATTDANGVPVFVVFSESAAAATGLPCGPGHRLTRFRAWSLLHFGGDESAAARALRALGRRTP